MKTFHYLGITVSLVACFFATSPASVRLVPSAYSTIQSAIDSSNHGDTILVAQGTYYENINFHGKRILLASNYLLTRNPEDIQTTIIDGSHAGDPDTQSVVLFISGEDTTSILEGFTITGGKGTAWQDEHSAGKYREGGGVLTAFTAPIIRNNIIIGNEAIDKVGLSGAGGGGIRSGDGYPRILNNIIMMNKGHYGAGIVLNFSGGIVRNNIIYQNSGGKDFGGVSIWINGNGLKPKLIENNTIVENSVPKNSGGGILAQSASVTTRNNIIWGNTALTEPQLSVGGSVFNVTYSDVQGGWTGLGNININPDFSDTSHYLLPTSPCIDAGNPSSSYNDPENTLIPGQALFPSRGTVRNDMGAYGGSLRSEAPYYDSHVNDPLPPSSINAYSDYTTPMSIHVQWHDPTARHNGTSLSGFAIRVYRNSLYVATVDSGIQSYVGIGLVTHQSYVYKLYTVTDADSSVVDSASAIAGGSAYPQPPTMFSTVDGVDGAMLTWKNPSRQVDGTPLNDFAYVVFYRDDVLFDSLAQLSADTAQVRYYNDTMKGYHTYRLIVRDNESPTHYSTNTSSELAYGGLTDSSFNDFESGLGSVYKTGSWDTTGQHARSGLRSLTDSPSSNYVTPAATVIYMPPIILRADAVLRFDHIAIVRPPGAALVDISTNQRKGFAALKIFDWDSDPQWQDGSADSADWVFERIDLSAYSGDTVTIRFRLLTFGTIAADGWYIDNYYLGPASFPAMAHQHVTTGWNLLSLPVRTADHTINHVYPTTGHNAFVYAGSYKIMDSLREGIGYWLKFPADAEVDVSGMSLVRTTVDVSKGWNIIGGLSSPMPASDIFADGTSVLSNYLAYSTTSGYYPEDTLQPALGYWVKVSDTGKLILRTDSAHAQPKTVPSLILKDQDGINTLTFRDARSQKQTLYFGLNDNVIDLDKYEIPPPPPSRMMDVRFASNRILELADGRFEKGVPILITSAVEPVTITWNIKKAFHVATLIINEKEIMLRSTGETSIEDKLSNIELHFSPSSAKQIPTSYALSQNYPNPFNPLTIINYQLPPPAGRAGIDNYVTLTVYNILGQEVAVLVNGMQGAGYKSVEWSTEGIASGVYYYRLQATSKVEPNASFVEIKKMMVVK